jgi:hypothetical protein
VIELDHVIVFCARDAPEADSLRARGLLDASGQAHRGQGTANRRFSFVNAYLELLWVENEDEARSDAVRPVQLWERWRGRPSGLCPFGLAFRPGSDPAELPPFPTWSYRPPYVPEGFSIEVSVGVDPTEPLLFYLPFARRRRPPSEAAEQPAGVSELVGVGLHLQQAAHPSESLSRLASTGLVKISTSADYLMELAFLGANTESIDLRPRLPIVFRPQETAV